MNYKRQLIRLKEKEKAMSLRHVGNESDFTYHGNFDLGYLQGQISILENIFEDLEIKNPASNEVVKIRRFENGLTVREFKEIIKDWPEANFYTGEDCEVWLADPNNYSITNQCKEVCPLNFRINDGIVSSDILLGF